MPSSWTALLGLAVGLGVRHGFDPDHLTVIDAIARRNVRDRPTTARLTGALFALGHGMVVGAACFATIGMTVHWRVPVWLDMVSAVVPIPILLGLGIANLAAAIRPQPDQRLAPVGFRSRLLPGFRDDRPVTIVVTGMVFAASFDTLTQTAALSAAGSNAGGIPIASAAAACFAAGMLVTSGLNGLWSAYLVGEANRRAAMVNRLMVVVIGMLNIVVGTLALLRLLSPEIDAWSAQRELLVGGLAIVALLLTFLFGARIANRRTHQLSRATDAVPMQVLASRGQRYGEGQA